MCSMVVTLNSYLTRLMRTPTRFNYTAGQRGTENEQYMKELVITALYYVYRFCECPLLVTR
jgi:hypothetical protein